MRSSINSTSPVWESHLDNFLVKLANKSYPCFAIAWKTKSMFYLIGFLKKKLTKLKRIPLIPGNAVYGIWTDTLITKYSKQFSINNSILHQVRSTTWHLYSSFYYWQNYLPQQGGIFAGRHRQVWNKYETYATWNKRKPLIHYKIQRASG